nr:MAG: wsv313-like protein [Marsupenaeus japonicus pemonivirus]
MALQLSEGAAILDSDVDEGESEKAGYFNFDDDDDDYDDDDGDDDNGLEEEQEVVNSYEDKYNNGDENDDDNAHGEDEELNEGYTGHVDDVFRDDPFAPISTLDSSIVDYRWSEGKSDPRGDSRDSVDEDDYNAGPAKLKEEKKRETVLNGVEKGHTGRDNSDGDDGVRKADPPKEESANDDRTRLERQRIVENYILGTTPDTRKDGPADATQGSSRLSSVSPPSHSVQPTPTAEATTAHPSGSTDEFDEYWQKYLIGNRSPGSEDASQTPRDTKSPDAGESKSVDPLMPHRSSPFPSSIFDSGVLPRTLPDDIGTESSQLTLTTADRPSPLGHTVPNRPGLVGRPSPLKSIISRESPSVIPDGHLGDIAPDRLGSSSAASLANDLSTHSNESPLANSLGSPVTNRLASVVRSSTPHSASRESPSGPTVTLTSNLDHEEPNRFASIERTLSPLHKSPDPTVLFAHPSGNLAEAGRVAREALHDIEAADFRRIKRLSLLVKVNLLKGQTKGLKCAFLVDEVFGTGDEIKQPSQACLTLLRDTIAAELTASSFARYANVVDMITAENFRMENSTLEALQRDQIMSNPIFSEIYTGNKRIRTGHDLSSLEDRNVNYSSSVIAEGSYEESTIHVSSRPTRSAILKQELRELLSSSSAVSPSDRLNRRHGYLRSLLDYKVMPLVSWSKFLQIIKNLSSRIINGVYGEEVPASSSLRIDATETSGDQHVGAIGTTLVIGTIKNMMDRGIINISKNIGEIAIMLGVPVAMLPWNTVFASSPEYRDILTRSLSRVAKDTSVSSMFLLNQILSDTVVDKDVSPADHHVPIGSNLSTEANRREAARRIFKEFTVGERSGKYSIQETRRAALDALSEYWPTDSPITPVEDRHLCDTIESVIDDKMPILENILNAILTYLDENTEIINMLVLKMLRKARVMNNLYNLKRSLEEEEEEEEEEKEEERNDMNSNANEREPIREYSRKKRMKSLRSMMKGSKHHRMY